MRTLLLTFLLLVVIQDISYSQITCPTYIKRNNGNGQTNVCAPSDASNFGVYDDKGGHFTFSTNTSNFTVTKVFYNNILIQDGTTSAGVQNGSTTFFGNIRVDGTSSNMCFYGQTNNANTSPAGNYRFEISDGTNTKSCSYAILTGNDAGLALTDPGSIGSDQNLCVGQSTTLTSINNATSYSSYKWQKSTTSISSGFTDIVNNSATYSTGALDRTTYFQRVAIDANNLEFASNVITVNVYNNTTWDGSAGNTFLTNANWTPEVSPSSGCSVTIPTSSTGTPQLSSNVSLVDLTIASGKSIDLSSNNLTLTGAFSNNGTISGTGNLIFGGSANQTISGNGTVKNLSISNTNTAEIIIAIGDANKLNVTGTISIAAGAGLLRTNDNLVLKSTATEQGTIGQILNCGTNANPIVGKITVERFIPEGRRAYRFITPGVTTTNSIRENWQEGANITDPNDYPHTTAVVGKNPNPGYGTHITGSTSGANGFDATITGNPSAFQFSSATQTWSSIANTNSKTLNVGEAYQVMIRGDRSRNLTINNPDPNSTTLRATGTPATCTYTFNTTDAIVPLADLNGEYSLIGNPYWSIVDWSKVTKTNVENKFYYFDPRLNGTNQRGGFVTFQINNNNDESQDVITKFQSDNITNRVTRYIQPGQAVFVKNTADNPIITFNEDDKISDVLKKADVFARAPIDAGGEGPTIDQARVRSSSKLERIYVSLFLQKNLSLGSADGSVLIYDQKFSDAISADDAPKFNNPDENLAFKKGNQSFSILGMQSSVLFKSDTIPLSMWNLYDQDYIIRVDLSQYVSPEREIFLYNSTTKAATKIPRNGTFDYSFRPSPGVRTNDELRIIFNSTENKQVRKRSSLSLSPNPISSGFVQLQLPTEEIAEKSIKGTSKIEVVNQTGIVVVTQMVQANTNGKLSYKVDNLPPGIYTIKTTINGEVYTNKFIKQ
jgi:hypothetical protein